VRDALSRLAARDRAVLTAFYLSDLSKETICQRLGLTPAQFDLIKWRALKRLLAALEESR
jgi:DNA-directed RNA polymerase specialized sigma24 family protein